MAILKQEIYKLITDKDGSCRDINFSGIEWMGVGNLIKEINDSYSDVKFQLTRSGNETIEIEYKDVLDGINNGDITISIYAVDSDEIIQQLQIFIFSEENGEPFIELTFFPQDLNLSAERIETFIYLIQKWSDLLQAEAYYVRYENASWEFGDTSRYSGIIYSSDMEIA